MAVDAGADGDGLASTLAKATAKPFSSAILPATSTSAAGAARQNVSAGNKIVESSEGCMGPLADADFTILHANRRRMFGNRSLTHAALFEQNRYASACGFSPDGAAPHANAWRFCSTVCVPPSRPALTL